METSINLLPWRNTLSQKKKRDMISRMFCYGLFCCFVLIATHFVLIKQINQLKNKNQILINENQHIVLTDPLKTREKLLNQFKTLFPLKAKSIKHNQTMKTQLAGLTTDLPNALTLTQLSLSLKKILLMGVGLHLSDIHQYSVTLQNLHWQHDQLFDVHNDSIGPVQIHFSIRLSP